MKRRMMTPDELQEALKGIVETERADREVKSLARSIDTLRGDLASSLALLWQIEGTRWNRR